MSLQLTAAQMRALGLSATQVDEAAAILQAHRQQQAHADLQRDIHIRQLLLQEHLEQQVQEQQLRVIGEQFHDFPDLQQRYQSLLLNEQLNRRREQVAQVQFRYQEELRRQHLGILAEHEGGAPSTIVIQSPKSPTLANGLQHHSNTSSHATTPPPLALVSAIGEHSSSDGARVNLNDERPVLPIALGKRGDKDSSQAVRNSLKRTASNDASDNEKKPKAKKFKKVYKDRKDSPVLISLPVLENDSGATTESSYQIDVETDLDAIVEAADITLNADASAKGTIDDLLKASSEYDTIDAAANIIRSLDVADLLSDSGSQGSQPKAVLDNNNNLISGQPEERIILPLFQSALPLLPVEPLFDNMIEEKSHENNDSDFPGTGETRSNEVYGLWSSTGNGVDVKKKESTKKVSAILDYPIPIDTWWPSSNGMRRERRNAGETSDEDNFEEASAGHTAFRANERKIRHRLSKLSEPGLLEKLPHCCIHRVRTKRKKNSSAPEFVYCWQVTEIYPNDLMVCCSVCGTWRHAACGGHHEAYSTRRNTEKPFVPICDFCYEEATFLQDYPVGAKRLARQRMEHIRRTLATSAVMRQASFSKQGGTYKWPLGSVTATHIAGHTRSVHARHDKAEKQWSDMGLRLSRGFGYRAKERVKSRTKELERLMVSIEDAESQTERHNMIHFLLRDTAREKPVGYEKELPNLFDSVDDDSTDELMFCKVIDDKRTREDSDLLTSAEHRTNGDTCTTSVAAAGDDDVGGHHESSLREREVSVPKMLRHCCRKGCQRRRRFDSVFCSDACGVSALESELLQALFETSEIHPSVLRP